MIEVDVEELFIEQNDGTYRLADDLPEPLEEAITRGEERVKNEQVPYVVEHIGAPHRPLDFGEGTPRVVLAQRASIFVSMLEEDVKFLSVGVSTEGGLSENQAQEALSQIGSSVDLSPDELVAEDQASVALNSLYQMKNVVQFNSRQLLDYIADLELLLDSPDENTEKIEQTCEKLEAALHNYLSSIYSFRENTDSTLKKLDLSRSHKHYIQKYEDEVSIAVGLRHSMQHNMALKVTWIGRYSHNSEMFDYTIGIPKFRVNNPDLYTQGIISDAGGDKHEPVDYYFGDIDSRFIDLEEVVKATTQSSMSVFNQLRDEIQTSDIEGVDIREKHNRIGKFGVMGLSEGDIS